MFFLCISGLSPIFTDLLSRFVTTVSVVFTCLVGHVWRWSERGMGRVLNASHHILSRVVTTTPHFFFFYRALLSVDSSMLFWMKSNTSPTRWETPEASLSTRNRCAMWQLIFSLHWRMVQQNMSRPAEFILLLTRPKHGIYPPRGLSSTWWRTTLSTVIYWLRLWLASLR